MFNRLNAMFEREQNNQNIQNAQNNIGAISDSEPKPIPARLYTEDELERNTHFALIAKLATTKEKWEEFKQFDKSTPMQRLLNLTPLKSTMAELMLLAIAHFEDVKDKRFFYQKDKAYYKEQIENRLVGLFKSVQPNRSLFIELLYNLYGYYFIAKHGTKEEAFAKAVNESKLDLKAQTPNVAIPLPVKEDSNVANPLSPRSKRRARNKRKPAIIAS